MSSKKGLAKILIGIFIVAIFFLALGGFRYLSQRGSGPVISVLSPESGTVLRSGQATMIVVGIQSESDYVDISLWSNGLEIRVQRVDVIAPVTTVALPWFGTRTGVFSLDVVALDAEGRESTPVSLQLGVLAQMQPANNLDFEYLSPEAIADGAIEGEIHPVSIQGEQPVQDSQTGEDQPEELDNEQPDEILGDPLPWPVDPVIDEIVPAESDAPIVTNFTLEPELSRGGTAAILNVTAEDDEGVERLVFTVTHESGDEAGFTLPCNNIGQCTQTSRYPLTEGRWWFAVQALDTDGQMSAPIVSEIEVMASEEGAFGAAVHDNVDLQLGEGFAALGDNFSPGADADRVVLDPGLFDHGFDLQTLLRLSSGSFTQVSSNSGDQCVSWTVTPQQDGNLVTVEYLCENTARNGFTALDWTITRSISGAGIEFNQRFEHVEENNTSLMPGERFSLLDNVPVCGAEYRYTIIFGWKTDSTSSRSEVFEVDTYEFNRPVCGPDDPRIEVQAISEEGGVRLNWQLLPIGHEAWSQVNVQILRNQEEPQRGFGLFSERLYNAQFNDDGSGVTDSFFDPQPACDVRQRTYYLSASPGFGKVVVATADVPRTPCPGSTLFDVPVSLTPGYRLQFEPELLHKAVVKARVNVPGGLNWPAGDSLMLRLSITGEEFTQEPGYTTEVMITPEMAASGFTFENVTNVQCTGIYSFYTQLVVDGRVVDSGPDFQVKGPPCRPESGVLGRIVNAYGSSDPTDCGTQPFCVVFTITPALNRPEAQSFDSQLEVSGYALRRESTSIAAAETAPDQFWELPLDQTRFVDAEAIACVPHGNSYTLRYILFNISGPGIFNGYNQTIFIPAPECDQPFSVDGQILDR